MTEHSIEEPAADVAEQSREVFPDADEPEDPIDERPPERPLEADEADAAEQARIVDLADEDDYI